MNVLALATKVLRKRWWLWKRLNGLSKWPFSKQKEIPCTDKRWVVLISLPGWSPTLLSLNSANTPFVRTKEIQRITSFLWKITHLFRVLLRWKPRRAQTSRNFKVALPFKCCVVFFTFAAVSQMHRILYWRTGDWQEQRQGVVPAGKSPSAARKSWQSRQWHVESCQHCGAEMWCSSRTATTTPWQETLQQISECTGNIDVRGVGFGTVWVEVVSNGQISECTGNINVREVGFRTVRVEVV